MVVVVMGVSGVGKTAVGTALAAALGWRFEDADRFHPDANVVKMVTGTPLTDADRAPWLELLRAHLAGVLERGEDLVLACSALRRAYRERLTVDPARQRWVSLTAPRELLARRMRERTGHFMPPALLDSQLATMEAPGDALVVDTAPPLAEVVDTVRAGLGL